jgi:hypothetical protein
MSWPPAPRTLENAMKVVSDVVFQKRVAAITFGDEHALDGAGAHILTFGDEYSDATVQNALKTLFENSTNARDRNGETINVGDRVIVSKRFEVDGNNYQGLIARIERILLLPRQRITPVNPGQPLFIARIAFDPHLNLPANATLDMAPKNLLKLK